MKDTLRRACGFICVIAATFVAFVIISTIIYG